MKTHNNKRAYATPVIERVELDNEISLTLDSSEDPSPWDDPILSNNMSNSPEFFSSNPIKDIT